MISQLVFHCCINATLLKLRKYVRSKEDREWEQDFADDGYIDFYDAFTPMFYFVTLYLIKLSCLKTDYAWVKLVASLALIAFILMGETFFDNKE